MLFYSPRERFCRIISVYEIILNCGSEENPIGTTEIRAKLKEKFGKDFDRRMVYSDVDLLKSSGVDIICVRRRSNLYYIPRDFDVAEIVCIMDAIQAAHFLTVERTRELLKKVVVLSGENNIPYLTRNYSEIFSNKTENSHTLYSIDTIMDAIVKQKKISFNYFDYDAEHNKVFRVDKNNNIKKYLAVPIITLVDNDNYYMIALKGTTNKLCHFRVDRMENVQITKVSGKIDISEISVDLQKYRKQLFNMYHGELMTIQFEINNNLLDVVCDKFGREVKMTSIADNKTLCEVTCQISPCFYAWCCGFGQDLKVVGPSVLVKRVKKYLKETYEMYK